MTYNVIEIAKAELGYMCKQSSDNIYEKYENPGKNGFSKFFIEVFPDEFHRPDCMAFIDWVFIRAYGKELAKKMLLAEKGFTYSPSICAREFKAKKQIVRSNPQIKDLIFLKSGKWIDHIAIVSEVTASEVVTIGANIKNADGIGCVAELKYHFSDSRIAFYGRIKEDM